MRHESAQERAQQAEEGRQEGRACHCGAQFRSRKALLAHQARVHVDGKELEDWAFYLQPLGDHWVTVARGPPSDVVDAYGEFTKTLRKVAFSKQAWEQEIRAGQPGFAILGIRDLLPSQRRKSYEDIVDEDPFC